MTLTNNEVEGIAVRCSRPRSNGQNPCAAERGLERRQLDQLKHLGMDEKSFKRGQSYITLLTDLEPARVVEVVEDRTTEAAGKLWESLSPEQKATVEAVAVDMRDPFIQTVRRQEHKELLAHGDETLTGSRQLWLYNPQNHSAE